MFSRVGWPNRITPSWAKECLVGHRVHNSASTSGTRPQFGMEFMLHMERKSVDTAVVYKDIIEQISMSVNCGQRCTDAPLPGTQ